ncbi:MFS transporter [Methylocapsa sp. S129]|uniref:MFS transporter n=1 Tax=Methylocapsa sp. S129 TaxID=1641869 RepID=UPI001FEE3F87|nr:MFS transporter [Methylocapsa sp. S129]
MDAPIPASPSTSPEGGVSKIARGGAGFLRATAALFFGGFSTFALLYSVQPLLPVFSRIFHVSPAVSSLSLSATTGVLAISMIAAGTISEILGRKRVMVASLAASSAATMLAAFSQDWTQLILLRALTGLALSGLPAVAMAYLGDEMDGKAIGLAMGLYVAGSGLGGLAGRLAVAVLADRGDWRLGILVVGAMGLASAGLLAIILPESRRFTPQRPNLRALWASLISHFADPGLRLLFLAAFLLMGGFVCVYNYIGYRLLEAPFSLSQTTIGLIFILYLAGTVSATAMGDLAGRFGRRRILWIAMAMMLAGVAATLPDNLIAIILGVALVTAGFFGAHSIASSWVGLRAEKAKAQASALYLFFYYLGSSVAGSAGGWFFSRAGWPGVAGWIGALACGALIVALRLARTPPPRHLANN